MKDPERLATTGTDEERRLLRAAQSVRVPDRLKDQVRRAVEGRMHRPAKRWWLAGAGLLVAATAAAAGLPLWRAWQSPPPAPSRPAPAPAPRPTIQPLPSPEPVTVPARPVAAHAPHPAPAPGTPAPPGHPPLAPELDLPGFLHPATEPAAAPAPAPAGSARLVINRSDRRLISLEATATSVRGFMRGKTVALTLKGKDLTGHIGDDAVLIHIFLNREAHGQVGGRELHFSFTPTDRGWIVEASLPDVGGQVRLESGQLAFRPGCDRPLLAVEGRPGAYEGECSDDTRLRVELPPGFLDPMARLVVLGMLLPEPEPMLRGQVPGLFPPP